MTFQVNEVPTDLQNRHTLDLFSLKGKNAVVFGGSKGIGLNVATAFVQAGANIVMTYHSTDCQDIATKLAKENGVRVDVVQCNVGCEESVEKAFEEIKRLHEKIDIVVANAGIAYRREATEITTEEFEHVMNVNVTSIHRIASRSGQIFKKQGFGNFIATSSMSGSIVNTPQTVSTYCTSKAAVRHYCKALAVEWAGFARVNTVSPGYIATDMPGYQFRKEWAPYVPMQRIGLSTELRGTYLFLASDASTFVTGLDLIVDGGYTVI
ncbi:short chain dehydrogenase [Schizosaccharomyces cryophilus OY26]|uniref:Short chain dehydrogenase n=1 Tax=Schizosaccharomyces cryophilus (strain OY26 / ATCC MYA-4695 / CBS 11777 / NBRC 106824 / NRRL Y48691) TaxID=653667 RepID=S9VTJ7_SCHCR|nr:short chain dehydrogenase [Schizosaccharomyces cryophilus OY26]EPY51198.1 short chain dehydrogenase [Schizosaccharomyces cryophilus OY26]